MTYTSVPINSTPFTINASTSDVIAVDIGAIGGPAVVATKISSPGAPGAGQAHLVRDTGFASAMNTITFTPGGSCTIDGQASLVLISGPGKARWIRCSGNGVWHTLGGEF